MEILIPDFQGLDESLRIVLDALPGHSQPQYRDRASAYRTARSGARYRRTLDLLENAKKISPGAVTKAG